MLNKLYDDLINKSELSLDILQLLSFIESDVSSNAVFAELWEASVREWDFFSEAEAEGGADAVAAE